MLTRYNGNLHASIMFIAEAPGRLGADRTGIPLHGDQTGDNFERLLRHVGLTRKDLFITNAVLCNPREESGVNGRPTTDELKKCLSYLRQTIELVAPKIVATLGAVALMALDLIEEHSLVLSSGVAKPVAWYGRTLFPLYHPSPRVFVYRTRYQQEKDFEKLILLK